jgi:hypothetical protein
VTTCPPPNAWFQVGTTPDTGRTQHLGERLALLDAADPALFGRVEPHVAEVELKKLVGQKAGGTADVVVVNVSDDEQVDAALAGGLRRDRSQAGPKHRVSSGPVSASLRQVRLATGHSISRYSP